MQHTVLTGGMEIKQEREGIVSVKFTTLLRLGIQHKPTIQVSSFLRAIYQDFNSPFPREGW